MSEKLTGYLLLFAGVGIIFYSILNVYNVFTKKTKPIDLFAFTGISLDLNQGLKVTVPDELQQAGVNIEKKDAPRQEIISSDILNQTSNLFTHVVLFGFIVNAGFKIASLGTQMARPIVVKINEKPKSDTKTTPLQQRNA